MKNKRLKFLLIHPEIARSKFNFANLIENECLELEYISSMLKTRNYSVEIYDGQVENNSVINKIKTYKPDIVYVCGRTRQESFMLEYCETAKEFNENIITIIGGLHAQLSYQRMYKKFVDFILITFDIFKILDIVDYTMNKKKINLKKIDGICYKKNNTWIKNDSIPFDINRLPLPDRTYFYNHQKNYRYLELEHAAWVRTSYSCPYHCNFCQRNKMNLGVYTTRKIEDVVNEIRKIKADNIYIVDDDFLINKKRVEEFIELIKKYKIKKKYICYGRSDFIAKNEEIMKKLKEIGLYYVLVGLETIDNKYLKRYNKKISINDNIKSIEVCNKYEINIMGMFITDLDFTTKDFKNLYNWMKNNKLSHAALSIFTPEFGTQVYENYQNQLITDNPSNWDYLHLVVKPKNLSVKKYYFYYYMLWIKLVIFCKKRGIFNFKDYDFMDYNYYIKLFLSSIFKLNRSDNNEYKNKKNNTQ